MTRGGGFSGRFRPADDRRAEAARHWVEGGDWVTQGDLGLMVQGEVCNTAELRGELDLPAGTPLAETLLAGWRRWDQGLLPRLDGVFALALRESGRIVLYRDPSGLRSLYLHEGPAGEVSFGSDLNRLVRLQGVLPRLARSSLHEYLRFGDISAPRAIYEGVLAVEPGQMVCASAAGIQMPATSPAATSGLIPSSFAEAVDQLDEYLYRSVAKRLAGTQRPAAFLSGGVDSALICAIAARQRPDLTALTVGFDGHAFDESPVAARIAEHLGLRHEVLRFGRRECLQGLERFAADAEQPLADPAAVVTMLAFERCQERFDSVLDGTGADEAIGLMPPRHTL